MPAEADGVASKKMTKQRTLDLIKSLEQDDDERTAISKKISWILRHGSSKVNVKMDEEGWVKVSDLQKTEILEDVQEEMLMAVIVDKNAQKLRYKLKETTDGTMYIKAYTKDERKATTSLTGESEKKSQGLRQDAPTFVPSNPNPYSPAAGLQLGYPWGFGFSPMGPQWPGAYPMSPFMMEGSGAAVRFRGRIKSFNLEKGFGFIECAETYTQFNRDVFLHKAQYGDMSVGTEVTFQVETNKQGMPQAKDLQPLGAASGGKVGKGKGKGAKGGRGGRGGAAVGGRGGGGGKGRGAGGEGNSDADAGAEAGEEAGAQVPAKEKGEEAEAQATAGAGEAEASATSTAAAPAAVQPSEQPGETGAAEVASK